MNAKEVSGSRLFNNAYTYSLTGVVDSALAQCTFYLFLTHFAVHVMVCRGVIESCEMTSEPLHTLD